MDNTILPENLYGGITPTEYSRPPNPVKVAPDYYYRQQSAANSGYTQPAQNNAPPSSQASPYGYVPNSRYYTNPYQFQAPMQYPYYDSDHYYVPPTYYGTQEEIKSTINPPQ